MIPALLMYQGMLRSMLLATGSFPLTANTKIVPILGPYTPGQTLQLSDLVLGSGDLAPIDTGVATYVFGVNPLTRDPLAQIPTPVGGFVWEYADTPVAPVPVYGFAFYDSSAGGKLFATSAVLDNAPLILNGGEVLVFDDGAGFRLVGNPLV